MEEWQRALKSHSDEEQEAQYDDKTTIRRGYSKNQVREMEFPVKDYQFPEGAGSFTGELVMKKWGKRGALNGLWDKVSRSCNLPPVMAAFFMAGEHPEKWRLYAVLFFRY